MVECKNCGQGITKVIDKWYHILTQKWYCDTSYAKPIVV